MRYADAHADTFYRVATEGLNPLARDGGLHVNVPAMRDVGQVLQVCSVFTPKHYCGPAARDFATRIMDALDASLAAHPGVFAPVRNRRDLAGLDGRMGLIPWLEGASPLAGDMALLEEFFARGVRGIGLTHNHANEVADGCGVAEPRRGLSDFGRQLVARMNELGVAVDCAHLPQPAFDDVMGMVKAPPCISHTGCRALVGITRNADDAMLGAIADRGGVVGIDFYPGHLKPGAGDAGGPAASCEDIADHILHAIDVCGVEHVAIGGDFDGFADTCTDLRHVGDLGNLERVLHARGVGEGTIEAVFSGNLLKYLGQVLPA
ncbi:MAG: membrane dipeptidase [Planctomycetes bacterium]|nr:membrane dipeptidase [Planctomycetota bacterium]